ncbi:MAG: hypothetical protein IPM54_12305 [Polyangiaceae bacterium]|nr:hypothetical protein [Polyangiaceae bacterium]
MIDDFKQKDREPVIAISVDMLDTGINVPEVINLVFTKAVKSFVKFWQIVGRGTRLCRDIFPVPTRIKPNFDIRSRGRNFWFFEEVYKEKQESAQKSLLQRLFEARVAVAEAAIEKMNDPVFQATVDLLAADIRDVIASKAIDVRDNLKALELLSDRDRLAPFDAAVKADLRSIAGPLMMWRDIRGEEDAYRFDVLVRTSKSRPEAIAGKIDLKAAVEAEVARLMKNQIPSKPKPLPFWPSRAKNFGSTSRSPSSEIRLDPRGIMKFQAPTRTTRVAPRVYDVTDGDTAGVDYTTKLEGLDLIEYRQRVEKVIREHFATDPVLQRIRAGKRVPDDELETLAALVLRVDDKANVKRLVQPDQKQSLLDVLRGLVGLDADAVDAAFTDFVHKYPHMSAQQLRFSLQVLKNHIAPNCGIDIGRLEQPPFTSIHAESIYGVFTEAQQVDGSTWHLGGVRGT